MKFRNPITGFLLFAFLLAGSNPAAGAPCANPQLGTFRCSQEGTRARNLPLELELVFCVAPDVGLNIRFQRERSGSALKELGLKPNVGYYTQRFGMHEGSQVYQFFFQASASSALISCAK